MHVLPEHGTLSAALSFQASVTQADEMCLPVPGVQTITDLRERKN